MLVLKAFAQVNTDFGPANNVTDYVGNIMAWVIPVIGTLAVLMIIFAGYIYMTSQGNPDRINTAKEILVGVIVGVALLFLIRLILSSVGTI